MIDPQSVDISSLPSVALDRRSELPSIPAIYFAIDANDVVQYIGMTIDPKARWNSHHRYGRLQRMGGVRIAYLEVSEPTLLPEIEAALIRYFDPPLNGLGSWAKPDTIKTQGSIQVRKLVVQVQEFPGLGKQIKEAREKDERSLSQICRECGISRAYWYQLESEDLRSPATEEVIRKIEGALGVDLGVKFDD